MAGPILVASFNRADPGFLQLWCPAAAGWRVRDLLGQAGPGPAVPPRDGRSVRAGAVHAGA